MTMKLTDKPTFTALFILIAVSFILLSGCSVQQQISLSPDGSGTAKMESVIDDSLIFYLESLAELTGENTSDGELFNLEEMKQGIEVNPGVRVTGMSNDDNRKLSVSLEFDDIGALIAGSTGTLNKQAISFTENGNERIISIYIDINNFKDIAPLFPVVDDPLFEAFGPISNQDTDEEGYLELIEYALGEGGSELLSKSYITTVIKVKGTIVSQKGGTKTGPDTVSFKTPLIRVLLLDKPIDYSITFK